MSTLIEKFLTLKDNYRNFDTRACLKRMQRFRRAVEKVALQGRPIALEILGSISFGIVEPGSDADCVLLHYCDLHGDGGECPDDCPNFVFEKNALAEALAAQPGAQPFNIEFLDCVNLTSIEKHLASEPFVQDPILYRMLYYCTVGRPVNRPFFIRYCKIMENNRDFMKGFIEWSSQALEAYLKTSTHRLSFEKYNQRIISTGLALPKELQAELKRYLEE